MSRSLLRYRVDFRNPGARTFENKSKIEGWGGETNREIDFGFGSVVRARGLVVRWEWAQNVVIRARPLSLFPFGRGRSSLFPWRSTLPPNLLSSFSWLYRYLSEVWSNPAAESGQVVQFWKSLIEFQTNVFSHLLDRCRTAYNRHIIYYAKCLLRLFRALCWDAFCKWPRVLHHLYVALCASPVLCFFKPLLTVVSLTVFM